MKPSSVTDPYPGPDLGDRPKFKVAIICEDSAAGKRAKHFYDRVIRELVDECDFSLELWNFQVLAVPGIGNSAAKAAAQADLVILSMHRKAQLSVQTRDWIERWSGLITDNKPALVVLLGRAFRCRFRPGRRGQRSQPVAETHSKLSIAAPGPLRPGLSEHANQRASNSAVRATALPA